MYDVIQNVVVGFGAKKKRCKQPFEKYKKFFTSVMIYIAANRNIMPLNPW